MLQRITKSATSLVDLLGIEGKILLRKAVRSAGLVALLLVTVLVAGVAAMGLTAAAVIALAPHIGTAGGLGLMSGVVLLICLLVGITVWTLMLGMDKQAKLDKIEQRLAGERAAAVAKLHNLEPEPGHASPLSFLSGLDLSKVDPTLVVATVGAAAAVVGPVRLLKLVGSLAGSAALISSLVSAGKAAVSATTHDGHPTPNGRSARR